MLKSKIGRVLSKNRDCEILHRAKRRNFFKAHSRNGVSTLLIVRGHLIAACWKPFDKANLILT